MENPFEILNHKIDDLLSRVEVIIENQESINKQFQEFISPHLSTQFVDIDTACEMTGLKKMYVYKLISQRKIPFHKLRRRVRFSVSELNDWIRAGRPNIMEIGIKHLKSYKKE